MKNAFTLVEGLIIVAILGLLGALVIPYFHKEKNPRMNGVLISKEMEKEIWHGKMGPQTNTIYYKVSETLYNSVHSNFVVYHE
jgi:Tfp pilus assembly major pilin PilA